MAETKDSREITGEDCSTAEDKISTELIDEECPSSESEDYSKARTKDPLKFIVAVCLAYNILLAKYAGKAYFQHLIKTYTEEGKALDFAFYSCLMSVLEIPGNENKHDEMFGDSRTWLCHDFDTGEYIKMRDRIRDCQQELFYMDD